MYSHIYLIKIMPKQNCLFIFNDWFGFWKTNTEYLMRI